MSARFRALILAALALAPVCAHAQTGPYTPTAVPDVVSTGTITFVNGSVTLNVNGQSSCSASLVGTWVGVLTFNGASDSGANYAPVQMVSYGGGVPSTSTTANNLYIGPCAGLSKFQVTASSWTSGTAVITLHGSVGSGAAIGGGGGGGGGNVNVLNFPTSQTVAGSVSVLGDVTIGNWPASQTVTGTISVNNFPATQPVSGTLSVGNFPSSQTINGTVTVTQPTGTNLHTVCDSGCPGIPWSYFPVPASAACVSPAVCVIKNVAGTLAGLWNVSTAAQAAGTCTLYDNASAAAGTPLYLENGIGSGQVIELSANGIQTANGITIQCSANPNGSGLIVIYK